MTTASLASAASPNNWIFSQDDLQHTPSRADGISYEQEMYERAFGVDLIVRVGSVRVSVPLLTVATASLFLQRFYMIESLRTYPVRETAMACLFLAGKVEESLRKVEAVVNYCLRLEERRKGREPDVHPSSEPFRKLVQQVLYTEEVILVALQFDLTISHPHPLISHALSSSIYSCILSNSQSENLIRCTWQILSDIYATPLCIRFDIHTLAAASFKLAWNTIGTSSLPDLPSDWLQPFVQDGQGEYKDEMEQDVIELVGNMADWYTKVRSKIVKEAGEGIKQQHTSEELKSQGKVDKEMELIGNEVSDEGEQIKLEDAQTMQVDP